MRVLTRCNRIMMNIYDGECERTIKTELALWLKKKKKDIKTISNLELHRLFP